MPGEEVYQHTLGGSRQDVVWRPVVVQRRSIIHPSIVNEMRPASDASSTRPHTTPTLLEFEFHEIYVLK